MKIPLIFDIKRTSTVDGPGVRTAVFFKGCNLRCFWCHNPESGDAGRQYAFFAEKCIGCRACSGEGMSEDERVACCPSQARKSYGEAYTPEALMEILLADRDFYFATGGGVTFSGGECLLYPDFAAKLAKLCREQGISVAIDTAGHVPFSHFEKVLPYADLFLYDIKCLDSELHRRGTGVGNERILENLDRLLSLGARVLIRIPQIPGFNEGEELERVCAYCIERELPYEILPYHRFGEDKAAALKKHSKEGR